MNASTRITLNVAATYGRSLLSLVCGLFTGRWLLMSLGTTDYGLYGVIGGLAFFVTFFNELLTSAVERFLAFALGEEKGNSTPGRVGETSKWFSVAVGVHLAVAVVALSIAYPIGVWAIYRYLNIPADRVGDCIWVFRLVVVNSFVVIATAPYGAMFRARQHIAELTVYSVLQTLANVAVLGYAATHPGDWLVRYSACWCAIIVLPAFSIAVHALVRFPECRLDWHAVFDRRRICAIGGFMASRIASFLGQVLSTQGLAIVVNKCLGASRNAAMTVSNTISINIMTMSWSVGGAFMPAIVGAAGEGALERMRDYAYRTCLLSALMVLVVAVPLSLEVDGVLRLWLKAPPEGTAGLCLCVFATAVIERFSDGHWIAIFALGDIRRYQVAESVTFVIAFALGWLLVGFGSGVLGAGVGVLVGRSASVFVRLWYGRKLAGLSVREWFGRVFRPVLILAAVSLAAGSVPRFLLEDSFVRIVLTATASLAVLLPLAWFCALSSSDRGWLLRRFRI